MKLYEKILVILYILSSMKEQAGFSYSVCECVVSFTYEIKKYCNGII